MKSFLLKNINEIILICFVGLFGAGFIFPDEFWSTHFLFFVPRPFLLIIFLCIFGGYFLKNKFLSSFKNLNIYTTIIISLIMGYTFSSFSIADDYYGNARSFIPILNQQYNDTESLIKEIFTFNLKPGASRWGVIRVYQLIAYSFNLTLNEAFKVSGIVFGTGTIFLILLHIQQQIKQSVLQYSLTLLCISSPFLLNFFTHIEAYALSLFLFTLWLYFFILIFKNKNLKLLWLLLPLLLICIRFNTILVMMLPMYSLSLLYLHFYKNSSFKKLYQLKKLFLYICFPISIIGVFIYFFVFKSYNDSRILDINTNDSDRLFLPLFSPEIPLHNYNLLSWNHVFDYLQVFLLMVPGICYWFVYLAFFKNKKKQKNVLNNLLLVSVFLMIGFLFLINPLMSLPMDWDLYCVIAPLVFILLILKVSKIKFSDQQQAAILYSSIVISLLSIPAFMVMFNTKMHSYRVEHVGKRVYKTYYQHSDSYLLYALQRVKNNELYNKRLHKIIDDLKPFTHKTKDKSYANLLLDNAINQYNDHNLENSRMQFLKIFDYVSHHQLAEKYITKINYKLFSNGYNASITSKKKSTLLVSKAKQAIKSSNYNFALENLKTASFYNPKNAEICLQRVIAYKNLHKFSLALKSAELLVKFKYPSTKKALIIATNQAILANNYLKAKKYASRYHQIDNTSNYMKKIYTYLQNNEPLNKIKSIFLENQF